MSWNGYGIIILRMERRDARLLFLVLAQALLEAHAQNSEACAHTKTELVDTYSEIETHTHTLRNRVNIIHVISVKMVHVNMMMH